MDKSRQIEKEEPGECVERGRHLLLLLANNLLPMLLLVWQEISLNREIESESAR